MHCPYCGTAIAKAEQKYEFVDLATPDSMSYKIISVVLDCDRCGGKNRVIDEKMRLMEV